MHPSPHCQRKGKLDSYRYGGAGTQSPRLDSHKKLPKDLPIDDVVKATEAELIIPDRYHISVPDALRKHLDKTVAHPYIWYYGFPNILVVMLMFGALFPPGTPKE
jgi:hypothetical protein